MKTRISNTLAAMLAATAFASASAQDTAAPTAESIRVSQPDNPIPKPPEGLVAEPVASLSRADGPDAERLDALVQALNADESMKHSKITVAPEANGGVLLTGVTLTTAQATRALEIATGQAGEGKVTTAIQASDY